MVEHDDRDGCVALVIAMPSCPSHSTIRDNSHCEYALGLAHVLCSGQDVS